MRLVRLDARRLPGGDGPFRVDDLGPGLNVVLGPNGSGKSSLCRAIQATLWPALEAPPATELVSYWQPDGEAGAPALRAELAAGVRWQRDGADTAAPDLPPPQLASVYLLGLRDLLDPDDPTGRDLAREVRIQISGGFDLAALRPTLLGRSDGRRYGRAEKERLREARAAHAKLRTERRELAEDEDQLVSLERELASAQAARALGEALGYAEELAKRRAHHDELSQGLDGLGVPVSVLESMHGTERDELTELDRGIGEGKAEIAGLRELRDAARGERSDAGLPDGPLTDAELDLLSERSQHLHRAAADAERVEQELAGARAETVACRAALAGDAGDERLCALDLAALDELSDWVGRLRELRERRRTLEAELAGTAAPGAQTPEQAAAERERLRRGADALRDWLASPHVAGMGRAVGPAIAVAGLAAAALGAALHPSGWSIAAWLAAGGLVGAGLAHGLARAGHGQRADAETRFASTGVDAPTAFEREPVRRRLAELDAEIARVERRESDLAQRARLELRLAALAQEEAAHEALRAGLSERLAVDPGIEPAALSDLLMRIRDWRTAERKQAEIAGRADAARRDCAVQLEAVARALAPALPAPGTSDEAIAAVQDLTRRCERWRRADAKLADAEARIAGLERQGATLRRRREELLARCALEDPGDPVLLGQQLEARLARRAEYLELAGRRDHAAREIARLNGLLEDTPELRGLSVSEAQNRRADARDASLRAEEIREQIGDIQGRIREACGSGRLEAQAAAVGQAREALLARRDELVEALVADLLVREVEQEFEEQTRPAVLQQASAFFAQFTRHRWSLSLAHGDDESRFRAIESESQKGHALAELSDGTRMQLLLAARLAFAVGAEHDQHPPIFLDEALTASDPVRFRAVAESLLELAGSGRQVFYLTCEPDDVARLAQIAREHGSTGPRVLDLAELRKLGGAVRGFDALRLPASEPVPAPDGLDAVAYARRLRVPRVDPHAEVTGLHLFHVLRDDLSLLHRVLAEVHVDRVGSWRLAEQGPLPGRVLTPEQIRRVSDSARIAEHTLLAWQIGRGRPVTRDVLAESGAVTDRFIDDLAELAAELSGDAEALLEALELREDARTRGFQSRKCEALREALRESGHLDLREPLDEESIRARVARDYFSGRGEGETGLDLAAVRRIVDGVLAGIREASSDAGDGSDAGGPVEVRE